MRLWQILAAQAGFSPLPLFGGGEDGGWYDPSDLSTMWTDTSGTTQVTSDGDLVARIDDKSGNGRHLIQATSTARPTYKTSGGLHWLDFDGGDWLYLDTAASSITDSGGALAVAAASDQAEAVQGLLEEVDTIAESSPSSFRNVVYFDTRSGTKRFSSYAVDDTNRFVDLDAEIDGTAKVFIFSSDGATGEGYLDNSQQGSSVTTTANFSNNTIISLGRQDAGPIYHDGKIYGAVILDRGLTTVERGNLNTYLSSKAGI